MEYKISRRHVVSMISSSAVVLCPAVLNAATEPSWGDIPTTTPVGQTNLIELPEGAADIDVTELQPGELAVVARPSASPDHTKTDGMHYIGILRRTDAQIAFGAANDPDGAAQDPRYYVADLTCPHRGKAIGFTGNAEAPFACTDRGARHGSIFDASGYGVAGASEKEYLSIPSYTATIEEDGGNISKAVISLA